MNVLFLGGTGNISTECVAECLARGHQVTVLTRGLRAVPAGVTAIAGDRYSAEDLARAAAAARWDAVVDFLAYTPQDVALAATAFDGRTRQYVFISTAAVYDKPKVTLPITEDAPVGNPHWEYARLKIGAEDVARRAHAAGLPTTIVRPSYTYGDTWIPSGFGGQDYTVVDRMRRGLPVVCHGDGTALWVMTHASDFARGFAGLLGNEAAIGETFHVTSDEVMTWDAIYDAIGKAAGVSPRIVHVPSALVLAIVPDRGASLLGDKSHSSVFDNAKLRRAVPGFAARVPFAEGIARSVAWFDADPARRVVSETANANIDRVLAAWSRAWEGLPEGGPR